MLVDEGGREKRGGCWSTLFREFWLVYNLRSIVNSLLLLI